MSIDRTQPLLPVTQVQPRETSDIAQQARKPATQTKTQVSGTEVKLSDAQAKLMQPGSEDINVERVETLKQAIRSGQLTMDTGKIADALLKNVADELKNI
ncbi:flagellar biosynthesis anti-sigma factor FlgM [Yersinia rohdei]|uniref:Negative regulator of flagellin synthesis n=1 Tax=Yersinia rohdei TaxID=29485 RepID=A0A0U1HSG4_YERRO|nr:flagellar biosynthesis anti-sigma factor FlgM [Yersinia rohdei]AJJ09357.1 flagellar biosynthesis anti-sigma factor FlgM [Yersinia rohdei]EEQ02258.1 Negative regulator of flagellin synthesis [Yersinia rohdei ATCC 43380]MDN0093802.1 flagellar biosynthesis anti-sigma factor FlgM [Yersinia rohdei]OWF81812.1 anti-sigma-28 factor FlgM [Yersinia rohdei]CND88390.1 anti-sigma-28 factor FlgM [Yersinia rohdei]